MKRTYKLTIETKARGTMPSTLSVERAIYGLQQHGNDFRKVDAEELFGTAVEVDFWCELYAFAVKKGKKWEIRNFFDSERKAKNYLKSCEKVNREANLHGEFAILVYCPSLRTWKLTEHTLKV